MLLHELSHWAGARHSDDWTRVWWDWYLSKPEYSKANWKRDEDPRIEWVLESGEVTGWTDLSGSWYPELNLILVNLRLPFSGLQYGEGLEKMMCMRLNKLLLHELYHWAGAEEEDEDQSDAWDRLTEMPEIYQ
jgi:hypothetical protein